MWQADRARRMNNSPSRGNNLNTNNFNAFLQVLNRVVFENRGVKKILHLGTWEGCTEKVTVSVHFEGWQGTSLKENLKRGTLYYDPQLSLCSFIAVVSPWKQAVKTWLID